MISNDLIVAAEALTKVYELGRTRIVALNDINVTIKSGEYVSIMGASGSGKSTLLHIFGCLDRPTSGEYFFTGRNVSHMPDRDLALIRATKIGFVFQTFNLIPQCTVYENVAMPFIYNPKEIHDVDTRVRATIDRVGLSERIDHRPGELSGGEMQRAAIARALVAGPALILADEPTGNLDSGTAAEIMDLLSALNEHGVTLIVVTHDHNVAFRSQRTLVLHDGRIADEGTR